MKISVISPVYNKATYLKRFFECLKAQSFRDFECIVIDDGSDDGSSELCDDFSAADSRFVVKHILNGGVSHARNVGIDAADGEYITFIDADDEIPENYLECLYDGIKQSKADICMCSVTKRWIDGNIKEIPLPGDGLWEFDKLLTNFARCQKNTGDYGYCCGKLFRRTLIEDLRFDESIRLAEDFDFFLRVYPRIERIYLTTNTTYCYLQNADNSSGLTDDAKIDYWTQLLINLRYRDFLVCKDVYLSENRQIVSQIISNYVYFTLFYCPDEKIKGQYRKVIELCKKEQIEFRGRSAFEKWILWLVKTDNGRLLQKSLRTYRRIRKIVRG